MKRRSFIKGAAMFAALAGVSVEAATKLIESSDEFNCVGLVTGDILVAEDKEIFYYVGSNRLINISDGRSPIKGEVLASYRRIISKGSTGQDWVPSTITI